MSDPNHTNAEQLSEQPEERNRQIDERPGNSPFPIVGIGASAGGLEAFTQLLTALPVDTGMAFLLVQHLDPRTESRLADLLNNVSTIPVQEAAHGMAAQPNHVYVIPANSTMAIVNGILRVTPRGEGRGPHLPVDFLFRSLAEDQQSHAIAVILSGSGSDGTLGLCEIKAVGGITFAQDAKSAAHNGMPSSAIDSGCVDFVMSPQEIAGRLGMIGRHPYLAPEPPVQEKELTAEQSYQQVLAAVRSLTGVDFTLYRDTTIRRRIMRRMALHSQHSLAEYARRLEEDQGEVDALYHDLLINVTSFFRDPEVFESLKTRVFPELMQGKLPTEPFRVWVPGCSTGQEAYSLAMTLIEFFDGKPVRPPIQIFATDLSDQTALDKARAGVYPESIESEVSPERLRRFFKREENLYRIDKSIRDICVFARQNVTADPPFSHLDLISCRNVLIYLATPLQKRVIPTFHYALDVPGFLMLGTAETVGEHNDLFEVVDRVHKIYSKKLSPTRHQSFFPATDYKAAAALAARRSVPPGVVASDFQKEADRVLLSRYAPPGVLINENFDILQFRGRTSSFLEAPPGEPTSNILKMAREGLFLELRNALNEARNRRQMARREGIRVRTNGDFHEIDLEVFPIHLPGSGEGCYLVLFQEKYPAYPAPEPRGDVVQAPEAADMRELTQLRQELAAMREYLQSMAEQQDAANEELRSANEEILSSNEELQSTNEELETAKEELQSANEELTTLNEQLQHRNLELSQLNNDLTNLLASTNIPVVMVGGDLRIRRVTAPARRVLNLLPSDVGRPISDINPAVVIPDLEVLIGEVIDRVQPIERHVHDRDSRWYALRIHPYRTADHKIDGAVIVLVDINQVRQAQEELEQKTGQLRQQALLIELSQDAVVVRNADDEVIFWNRGAQEMYGWSAAEVAGKKVNVLLQTDPAIWGAMNTQLDRTGMWEGELRQVRRDGAAMIIHSREVIVRDEEGNRLAVLAIKRDITDRKRVLEALREADRRKDEFLATLAHELRNPLAPVRNAVEIMRLAGDDPATIQRAREVLDRQVTQLSRIVEDLIDVSRIVEKKIELRKERVALASIVETAVETSRSFIERCGHELSIALPSEPIYLDADPVRMCQVLVNLLNNAAKYTEPGGSIRLIAEQTPAEDEVLLRVRDTGVGIPADMLSRIFDMFTQGNGATELRRAGLGVGLTLVRSLVQMHHGSVEAYSDGPGRGSEFVVRLPLTSTRPSERVNEDRTLGTTTQNPKRVLVVDDNQDQAESLGMLLRLMGHGVQLAYDGVSALRAADEFAPDVALVDIGLPGMNGYEVARRLRQQERFKDLMLVAQTGWGQDEDRNRSRQAGFDHHLVKPVSLEALKEILQAMPGKDRA